MEGKGRNKTALRRELPMGGNAKGKTDSEMHNIKVVMSIKKSSSTHFRIRLGQEKERKENLLPVLALGTIQLEKQP
jgi:hypothetical protein